MPIRVLVVDDHAIFRGSLVRALSWTDGIEVIGEATGGVAACGSADELEPDVVVMDVSMPDLSGIEAMQLIHRRHPGLPVVFLTAGGDAGPRREALAAGGAGYVAKGAALAEIVRAVETAGERAGIEPVRSSPQSVSRCSTARSLRQSSTSSFRASSGCWSRRALKSHDVIETVLSGVTARTVADRGPPSRSDISPK